MIDLHIHTDNSDGKYTVEQILKMAKEIGLNTISFCDHNVLGAYEKLTNINVKELWDGKIITGIEFDFVYKKKDFHMLGYNFDAQKLNKSKFLDRRSEEELIKEEEERLEFFKNVCKKLNIKLSENLKITSSNIPANDIVKADMQIHEENKKALDEILGEDRKKSFWLGHVTNPESPFYIDFTENLPTAIQVAEEIHNAGGLVVLAHPFEYKSMDNIKFLEDIYDLKILDGIECVHTKHTREQVLYLEKFCKEHNLIMSGGSDFHSENSQTLGYTPLGKIDDKYCLRK